MEKHRSTRPMRASAAVLAGLALVSCKGKEPSKIASPNFPQAHALDDYDCDEINLRLKKGERQAGPGPELYMTTYSVSNLSRAAGSHKNSIKITQSILVGEETGVIDETHTLHGSDTNPMSFDNGSVIEIEARPVGSRGTVDLDIDICTPKEPIEIEGAPSDLLHQ